MKSLNVLGTVVVLGMLFVLTGCGGGGGGGAGSSTTGGATVSNATYTGSTSPATITASNAKSLATSAYEQVENALSLAMKSSEGRPGEVPFALTISGIIEKDAVSAVEQQFRQQEAAAKSATQVQQDTVNGYSGSATVTMTVDTTTGYCSGVFAYNKYVAAAGLPALHGVVVFAGIFNVASGSFDSFTVTIEELMTSSGAYSVVLNGNLAVRTSGANSTITMSAVLTTSSGYKSKVEGYEVVLTGSTLTIRGTFYDSTDGYVVLTTVTPLQVPGPTSGQVLVAGASNTKARLTFNSTGYVVEYDSGSGTWVVVN